MPLDATASHSLPDGYQFSVLLLRHGYGYATRVSGFAPSLLALPEGPQVFIVSSALKRVFSECLELGAFYRNGDIDPIVVQPVAVLALQHFLEQKEEKLQGEVAWLLSERIDCVLSDAAFLGCEAATQACIPSVLVTNFTFDSVYSYLAVNLRHGINGSGTSLQVRKDGYDVQVDTPIPNVVLEPLVEQLYNGYRYTNVPLLLPGHIPIHSFFQGPSLPSSRWIYALTNKLSLEITHNLSDLSMGELHPSASFPPATSVLAKYSLTLKFPLRSKPARIAKRIPLLVRSLSSDMKSMSGRSRLLLSLGISRGLQDAPDTRIVVVSFGDQIVYRPHGRSPSPQSHGGNHSSSPETGPLAHEMLSVTSAAAEPSIDLGCAESCCVGMRDSEKDSEKSIEEEPLPSNFYIAPSDVYMSNLTAVADVLLGKMGYGTVSECIAYGTPLVYVPRPLFVEEHGLRLWLKAEGIGVELSREEYESGQWASKIEEAFEKRRKTKRGIIGGDQNEEEIQKLAAWVLRYVEAWQRGE
ncbi:hypothetical protein M422DRAFT_244629 [Sphaerobolus stellatus SS14]|nr:hypothetical protein M422DRAFT_244629 [Sphaerobolus stellatus SS14]